MRDIDMIIKEQINFIKQAQIIYEETDSLTIKIEQLQMINRFSKDLIKYYEISLKEEVK